jgi:predicted transcriptional regulator
MRKKKREEVIFVKSSDALKKRLKVAAEAAETDMSDIVRDAVNEKLIRLAKKDIRVAQALEGLAA